jgi:NADH-quinone oxidoreductase subunit N
MLSLTLISLAGIPPFSGFFAKLLIFLTILETKNYFLLILIFVMSIFSSVYYLRILLFLFMIRISELRVDIEELPTFYIIAFIFLNLIFTAIQLLVLSACIAS